MQIDSVLNLVVSVSALTVSAWAAILTHRAAKRQNGLQERLLELELGREAERRRLASKAVLHAEIVASDGGISRLLVRNDGQSPGRDVRLSLDGRSILDHELSLRGQSEVRDVAAQSMIEYALAPDMDSPAVVKVRVEWQDNSGEGGAWESPLRVL